MIAGLVGLLVAGAQISANPVFVNHRQAAELIKQKAIVLDARGNDAEAPYLPSARPIDWKDLRDGWGRTGRLDELSDLQTAFRKLGVQANRPVLVYGAFGKGWGEEGRIWWTLRYLGHSQVYVLNGGISSWVQAGHPTRNKPAEAPRTSAWRVEVHKKLRVDDKATNRARGRPEAKILDTRSREEYLGATPYWSYRGGHIPGARHFDFRRLIGADGQLLPPQALKARFMALGLRPEHRIIAYCTGGVRSAFMVAALMQAGYTNVANYDGSWWEWASQEDLPASK